MKGPKYNLDHLDGLLETLELLVAQAQTYERALTLGPI